MTEQTGALIEQSWQYPYPTLMATGIGIPRVFFNQPSIRCHLSLRDLLESKESPPKKGCFICKSRVGESHFQDRSVKLSAAASSSADVLRRLVRRFWIGYDWVIQSFERKGFPPGLVDGPRVVIRGDPMMISEVQTQSMPLPM